MEHATWCGKPAAGALNLFMQIPLCRATREAVKLSVETADPLILVLDQNNCSPLAIYGHFLQVGSGNQQKQCYGYVRSHGRHPVQYMEALAGETARCT